MEYNYRMGIVVLVINITVILCCSIGSYFRFKSAIHAKTKLEADQHFIILLCFLTFLVANSIALYTGYVAFIDKPSMVRSELVQFRLADRSAMLVVSILMIVWGWRIKGVLKDEE